MLGDEGVNQLARDTLSRAPSISGPSHTVQHTHALKPYWWIRCVSSWLAPEFVRHQGSLVQQAQRNTEPTSAWLHLLCNTITEDPPLCIHCGAHPNTSYGHVHLDAYPHLPLLTQSPYSAWLPTVASDREQCYTRWGSASTRDQLWNVLKTKL